MISFFIEKSQKNNNSCFLLVLVMIGILMISLQSLAIADEIWTPDIPDNEVLSSTNLENPCVIYATKIGYHVVVYKRNLIDGKQNVIFEYDEYGEYGCADIALSSDGQCFAFADKQGLKIYNLSDGKQRNLIIREPTPKVYEQLGNDYSPAWSTPSHKEVIKSSLDLGYWYDIAASGMTQDLLLDIYSSSGLHDIVPNGWSSDGKYVSFIGALYEGSGEGIIELETERLFHYGRGADSMSWSPSGHFLLMASSAYAYGYPGLFVVKLGEMDQAKGKPVIESIDKKFGLTSNRIFLCSQAIFSPNGREIAFTFREGDESGNYPDEEPASLAIANADGTGFQILEKGDDFYCLMFSPDSDSIFYIQKQENNIILKKCVLASKAKMDIAILPSTSNKDFWTKEGFLSLHVGNENGSRILILNIDRKSLVYASPIFNLLDNDMRLGQLTIVGFSK